MPIARRKPWAACLLSLAVPGLGQVYNGQAQRGILFFCLLFVGAFATITLTIWPPSPPYTLFLCLLVMIVASVAVIVDAVRTARRLGDTYQLKTYNRWHIYLAAIVLFGFALDAPTIIKTFYVQSFKIPSGAMMDTLLPGDHIEVMKFFYAIPNPFSESPIMHLGSPKRGDIIVFKFPEDESKNFIKRVIGVPGDTIEIRNKQLWINSAQLTETYVKHVDPNVIPASVQARDILGPLTVPPDSYFVLGDNRDQSLDSRFWGFVKSSKILGKARVIYWSWDSKNFQVRWERIGKPIN
jgi:signal peptidase I